MFVITIVTLALRVERRISDRQVAGSTPSQALLCNNLRQVVHTVVLLSPSSISWYRCENSEVTAALVVYVGRRSAYWVRSDARERRPSNSRHYGARSAAAFVRLGSSRHRRPSLQERITIFPQRPTAACSSQQDQHRRIHDESDTAV